MKITANVKCAKQRLKLRRKVFSYLLFGAFCLAALFFLYDYQFGGDSDTKVWNNRSLLSAATCRESKTWEKKGGVTIYFIGVLYLFLGIAIVCDDFFVASLESISHVLHLSEDVAGATFMAAGSSAPELFSSMMALTNPNAESEIGVGTIVGSAVFNILVIIGITAVFAGRTLHLDWKPLIRDAVFYLAAVASILLIFMDKKVYWWEGLICVLCYAGYVLFMAYNHTIMSWIDSKMGSRQNMHEMQTSKSDISLETMTDGIKSIPSGQQDLAQLERLEVQPEGQGGTGNNQDEEVEEEDSNPFALPEKAIDIPMWLLSLPWYVAYTYTIPPCNKERWANWYPVTFIVSILWIGGISWFMVDWAMRIGCILKIPTVIMGVTVLAAGTSIPDALSSIAVAKDGKGDMAVANAVGSNVFDIWLGLGLPWAIVNAITGALEISQSQLLPNVLILLSVLIAYLAVVMIQKWHINMTTGYVFLFLYGVYCLYNVVLVWLLDIYGIEKDA